MSEGLRFLGSVCETGSRPALTEAEDALFTDIERPAVDFIRSHVARYGEFPSRQTVALETQLRLPPPVESLQFYDDALRDRHTFNQVRDRLATFQGAYRDRNMDVMTQSLADMHSVVRHRRGERRSVLNFAEAGELVLQRLESTRFMGGLTGALTGGAQYDAITGGYQPSDLITIVARMGVGKTWKLLQQALYSFRHDQQSVLLVTTEMGTEPIARRLGSLELGINPIMLKRNTISTYTERRLRTMYREMASADRLRIFSVGMGAKTSAVAALCQEYRPSIAYIDGAYLMQPANGARNASRTERISYVFDELKALNLEMDIPIVVSTQFNRQAGKGGKEGSLETIGYSDAIGTHSSVIVAVRAGPTEDPRKSRTSEFLKGREGEAGVVHTNFQFAPLNMDEMDVDPETGEVTDTVADGNVQEALWRNA
jgi:Replicative DNA helicase